MFDIKELAKAVKQVAEEKSLPPESIFEAIEQSLAAAYKKELGKKGEVIRAKLEPGTGELHFWQVKQVVEPNEVRIVEDGEEAEADAAPVSAKTASTDAIPPAEVSEDNEEVKLPRYNPDRHIFLEEAKKIKSDSVSGEELLFTLEPRSDFGRIAAQTAKQVILQKLRESERDSILKEWRGREGQVVSGTVQRFERGNVFVDLGRATGIMFGSESIPGEHYRTGERLRFLVLAVQDDMRLPGIVLSRAHPRFVTKLFEMEVPELADGVCEVRVVSREPGSRTKIAVASRVDGVDPVGAFVGQRGTRVMSVNNELGLEKIDIIDWSDDPKVFIASSLSPAKVQSVEVTGAREARVYVPDDQLSLAIGRGGQNVRLAAKLTGWKIDVRSQSRPEEVQEGGVATTGVEQSVAEESEEKSEIKA